MIWKEITSELNERALQFCMQFLPNGRREGAYWRTGNILDGKGGRSFIVYVDGPKRGYWVENGDPAVAVGKYAGKQGALIDIVMAQRDLSFSAAVNFAKDWLGIVDNQEPRYWVKKPSKKPDYISTRHLYPIERGTRAYDYLCGERLLSPEILKKYRVQACKKWFAAFGKEVDAVAFPIYSGKGDDAELLNIKYLALDRPNGKKCCSQEKGGVCALFGWQAMPDEAREVVICEGEIDAMTVAMLGIPALSVPEGAHADGPDGKQNKANEWINTDWERLEPFETVKVCMDSDDVGKAAANTLMQRLGVERTELVEIPAPYKDPNEIARDGDVAPLMEAIAEAKARDPKELARAVQFAQQLKDRLDGKSAAAGRPLPWNLGDHFKIRDYEVTVVSGYSGHGKTAWLDDLLVNLCAKGETACIASLEVPIPSTMETLFRQCSGRRNYFERDGRIVPNLFENAVAWLNERIFFYNHVGRARVDDMLKTFRYCFRRYGAKLFVVDSLMCCDVGEDDKDGQKAVMQKFCDFVMANGCHLFLVAHSKKPSEKRREDKDPPGKHDVNGSAHITDLAHNVVVIYRTVKKEMDMEALRAEGDWEQYDKVKQLHDAVMYVRKQREGTGRLPAKNLWFDLPSRQFRDAPDKPVRAFVQGDPDFAEL